MPRRGVCQVISRGLCGVRLVGKFGDGKSNAAGSLLRFELGGAPTYVSTAIHE